MQREVFPEVHARAIQAQNDGRYVATLDVSHTTPDWDRVLTLGIPGLLELAEKKYQEKPSVFYESVKRSYAAFRDFVLRFSRLAGEHGREDLSELLAGLADHAPRTLHEALQLSILYFHVQEIEGEWVRSFGIFDRQYFPFYKKDLASGLLTAESAEELLIHYFSFFHAESKGKDAGAAICFGGLLPGKERIYDCNELTWTAWNAFRKLGNPSPKFSVRWNPETPDEFLDFASDCIREGTNSIVFANEPLIRQSMLRQGKAPEDLPNFVPIGCYEPAIMGKELSCTMTCRCNLAKPAEMLFDDTSFHPETYEEVETYYFRQLETILKEAMADALEYEKAWYKVNPSPILSGTLKGCMERGLDVSQYGTEYSTSGVVCLGIATAVDALMSIKTIVFDRKTVTFDELRTILADNWNSRKDLQEFAKKRPPKWGTGNPEADRLGQKICHFSANLINHTPNAKGGTYQMGLWSINLCLNFGARMKATADGRSAGTTLSKNSGCTAGCDSEGIAGLFETLSGVDHADFPDGAVLDVILLPQTVAGPEGTAFISNLIKTFFNNGGMFIHFNVFSVDQLKEAQLTPDKYRNLQVRLCGWNVRFIDLSKNQQDWLIREAEGKF
jgi:formate C-acetyltransferase